MEKKDLSKSIVSILFTKYCSKNLLFVKMCHSYENAEFINTSNDLKAPMERVTETVTDVEDIAPHLLVDNSDNGVATLENTIFLELSPVIMNP